ncbi:MAG: exodeoxyribonuclease VII small subunit [Lachnospiraceae bacterium]|nr:exodeoxyribonuclease VII small subunit [Lachnospiraceae bacterium]
MTLEETFEKIDVIMEKLSDDDLPLEESFEVYKEGMGLLDKCKKIIDDVEKKVEELSSAEDEE